MGSLLRRVKERKKTRRLGEVEVMEQEGYGELEVEVLPPSSVGSCRVTRSCARV